LLDAVTFTGKGGLPSPYAVTDLASASIATAALSIAELVQKFGSGFPPAVSVDRRMSSFWFGWSIRPIGWDMPPAWDALAGDYHASDGWIRLHTNAPHHRAAAERVLGRRANKDELARAAACWSKHDLEKAIVDAGGCAAEMRSTMEWANHPQGRAISAEPLVHIVTGERAIGRDCTALASRPLSGIRVLDLTRVLAGPVASRFLAGYGAEVLRIDPPGWNEPGVIPEVTLGKRCARLDLKDAKDRATFEALLSKADVFLHSYRPGALDRLGYNAAVRRALSPGLIDVGLSAYGWSEPWGTRRGFDSLVQMSTGIADRGMRWKGASKPVPLPVQALDQATGYLMAATAVRGITQRLLQGIGMEARLSLARTAKLLVDQGDNCSLPPLVPETVADVLAAIEKTSWGESQRLIPPVIIESAPMHWCDPANSLGSAQPRWTSSIVDA